MSAEPKVIAEDISPDVEELATDGIWPLVADVSKEESAAAAVQLATEKFGRLDILVNNAAQIMLKPSIEISRADWDGIMNVNITGPFLHSREALKAMVPVKSGTIVNNATSAALFDFAQLLPYSVSKSLL